MKQLRYILLLFTSFTILSCNNDDSPPQKIPDYTISFVHEGNLITLKNAYVGTIVNSNSTEIGRFVRASSYFPDDPNQEKYTATFLFYTTGSTYEMYGFELIITEPYPYNGHINYIGSQYENYFSWPMNLPFTTTIVNDNGNLAGEFGGELFDNGDTFETISNGKINFPIPAIVPSEPY